MQSLRYTRLLYTSLIFIYISFLLTNATAETKSKNPAKTLKTLNASTTSYIIQDSANLSTQDQDDEDLEPSVRSEDISKQQLVPEPQPVSSPQQQAISSDDIKLNQSDPITEPLVKWINSNDLLELLMYVNQQAQSKSANVILIDTRNSNEYNGWKSFSESNTFNNQSGLSQLYDTKNGHVNDAHNFDSDWIHFFDPDLLNNLVSERLGLRFKNNNSTVSPNDSDLPTVPIVLYDTKRIRLENVKSYLINNFIVSSIYLCPLEEHEISNILSKTNETNNLFFQEPFFDMLISAEVLNNILRPFNDSYVINVKPIADYKLLDVSQSGPEEYERSHIPTALHLSIKDLEDSSFIRKNKSDIARILLDYGILPNNTEMIILYGNPDPIVSFRAAIILKWMGVRDVHVLNGGYRSWLIKNLPVETYSNKKIPIKKDLELHIASYEEQSILAQNPINYIVDFNYVNDIVKNHELFSEHYVLVDIRSYEEHIGEKSGYPDLKAKGRIPTSLWGRSGTSSNQLEDYRNLDLTMRSGVEILKMWDDLGIDYKFKHLIFYSGNALRASEVMYYAELMGLYKISLYDGGWYDWSSNPNNAFQLGPSNDNESISFENFPTTTPTPLNSTDKQTSSAKPITSSNLVTTPGTSSLNTNKPSQNQNNNTNKFNPFETTKQNRPQTTRNASDLFYKHQFDQVTATNANSGSKQTRLNLNLCLFIIILCLFL